MKNIFNYFCSDANYEEKKIIFLKQSEPDCFMPSIDHSNTWSEITICKTNIEKNKLWNVLLNTISTIRKKLGVDCTIHDVLYNTWITQLRHVVHDLFWKDEWIEFKKLLNERRKRWWREFLFNAIDEIDFDIRSWPWWKELFISNVWDNILEENVASAIYYLSHKAWTKLIKFNRWIINDAETWELSGIWRSLMWVIWENHPLVPIQRINKWDTAVNVTFKLKRINDKLSPELADVIKAAFKAEHIWNFDDFYSQSWFNKAWESNRYPRWRFLTATHKNTTYSIPEGSLWDKSFVEVLFWTDSIDIVAEKIINKKEVQDAIINHVNTMKWVLDKKAVEWIILNEFNFWIWFSTVDKDGWGLKAFRNANSWSEVSVANTDDNRKIGVNGFTSEDTKLHGDNHLALELQILTEYAWESFILGWKPYPVVVDGKISWVLLQAVKKWELVSPDSLVKLVEKSSSELNLSAEFISPTISEENFDHARQIISDLDNLEIKHDTLKYTYKGELSKDAFFESIRWSSWIDIRIDIIWFTNENRDAFRKLLIDFLEWRADENDLSTQAWLSVTKDFLNGVREIVKYNPSMTIWLWWDETWWNSEWIVENPDPAVINRLPYWKIRALMASINKSLGKLNWRITFGFDRRDKRGLHDYLDNEWKPSKVIEWIIQSEILSVDWEKWLEMPSVMLDISHSVTDELYARLLDKAKCKELIWKEGGEQIIRAMKNPWTVEDILREDDTIQISAKFEDWLLTMTISQIDYKTEQV